MGTKKVRLGSVGLLCALVVLCVVVLSVLCIAMVRSDWALTQHSADVTREWYELQNEAQIWLSQTDAALRADSWEEAVLPEGTQREGERITATLQRGEMNLTVTLERGERRLYRIKEWRSSRDWDEEAGLNLFLPDN